MKPLDSETWRHVLVGKHINVPKRVMLPDSMGTGHSLYVQDPPRPHPMYVFICLVLI